jgi:hypothetical protein
MVRRHLREEQDMARRKAQTSTKPRAGTKTRSKVRRAKPTTPNTRAKSKQDAVLTLLSRPQGATIEAMIEAKDRSADFGARKLVTKLDLLARRH